MALYAIRKREYDGIWTAMFAVMSAVGLVLLLVGTTIVQVVSSHATQGRSIVVASPGFVVAGAGVALALLSGLVGWLCPEDRSRAADSLGKL
jgi:hypothetical protein